MKVSRPLKFMSVSLAGLIFVTNVVLVHAAEVNWVARQAQEVRGPQSVVRGIKTTNYAPRTTDIRIPAQFGTIRTLSKGSPDRIILHIQDVHMNTEAQKNIDGVIQYLMKKDEVDLVALEGAFGEIGVDSFRDFSSPQTAEDVAGALLEQNQISGPVHAAFAQLRSNVPFVGVDDKVHYDKNVAAVKKAFPLREELKKAAIDIDIAIDIEKKNSFNKNLYKFDQVVQKYRSGKIELAEYSEFLLTQLGNAASRHPGNSLQIQTYREALNLEQSLNTAEVEHQRSIIISQLVQQMKETDIQQLMAMSTAFQAGTLNHADFYAYLQMLCEQKNISFQRYTAMRDYLQYILLSNSIDGAQLIKDIRALEEAIYDTRAQTSVERSLIQKSRRAYLRGKLIDFALTKDEWEEYKTISIQYAPNRIVPLPSGEGPGVGNKWPHPLLKETADMKSNNSGFVKSGIGNLSSTPGPSSLRRGTVFGQSLRSFEKFYQEAEARDKFISENLQREIHKHDAKLTILITGGFHTHGIHTATRQRGNPATMISFTPKISQVNNLNGTEYLSIFAQEKTPLEQLFAGQKLFLAPPIAPMVSKVKSMSHQRHTPQAQRRGSTKITAPLIFISGIFWFGLTIFHQNIWFFVAFVGLVTLLGVLLAFMSPSFHFFLNWSSNWKYPKLVFGKGKFINVSAGKRLWGEKALSFETADEQIKVAVQRMPKENGIRVVYYVEGAPKSREVRKHNLYGVKVDYDEETLLIRGIDRKGNLTDFEKPVTIARFMAGGGETGKDTGNPYKHPVIKQNKLWNPYKEIGTALLIVVSAAALILLLLYVLGMISIPFDNVLGLISLLEGTKLMLMANVLLGAAPSSTWIILFNSILAIAVLIYIAAFLYLAFFKNSDEDPPEIGNSIRRVETDNPFISPADYHGKKGYFRSWSRVLFLLFGLILLAGLIYTAFQVSRLISIMGPVGLVGVALYQKGQSHSIPWTKKAGAAKGVLDFPPDLRNRLRDANSFAERFTQIFFYLDFSVGDFNALHGLSKDVIARMEQNTQVIPQFKSIIKLSQGVGVSPVFLLTGKNHRQSFLDANQIQRIRLVMLLKEILPKDLATRLGKNPKEVREFLATRGDVKLTRNVLLEYARALGVSPLLIKTGFEPVSGISVHSLGRIQNPYHSHILPDEARRVMLSKQLALDVLNQIALKNHTANLLPELTSMFAKMYKASPEQLTRMVHYKLLTVEMGEVFSSGEMFEGDLRQSLIEKILKAHDDFLEFFNANPHFVFTHNQRNLSSWQLMGRGFNRQRILVLLQAHPDIESVFRRDVVGSLDLEWKITSGQTASQARQGSTALSALLMWNLSLLAVGSAITSWLPGLVLVMGILVGGGAFLYSKSAVEVENDNPYVSPESEQTVDILTLPQKLFYMIFGVLVVMMFPWIHILSLFIFIPYEEMGIHMLASVYSVGVFFVLNMWPGKKNTLASLFSKMAIATVIHGVLIFIGVGFGSAFVHLLELGFPQVFQWLNSAPVMGTLMEVKDFVALRFIEGGIILFVMSIIYSMLKPPLAEPFKRYAHWKANRINSDLRQRTVSLGVANPSVTKDEDVDVYFVEQLTPTQLDKLYRHIRFNRDHLVYFFTQSPDVVSALRARFSGYKNVTIVEFGRRSMVGNQVLVSALIWSIEEQVGLDPRFIKALKSPDGADIIRMPGTPGLNLRGVSRDSIFLNPNSTYMTPDESFGIKEHDISIERRHRHTRRIRQAT